MMTKNIKEQEPILVFREYLNDLRINADRHLRNTISEIDNDLTHLMEDIKNNAK